MSLGALAYTKNFESFNFDIEDMDAEGRGIGERYSDPVRGKSKATFGGSVLRTSGGVRQTMLSMSVFTVGGTSKIGRLESGSMSGTTILDPGEAGNDPWEYPFAVGTDIKLDALMKITSLAEYASIMNGATTGRNVVVVLTMGGSSITMPAKIQKSSHKTESSKIQSEDVSFSIKGSASLAATGDPLLISAIAGSANVPWSCDTGANVYSNADDDGAIVTSFGFNFASGQITKDNFQFQVCGQPTIS